MWNLTSIWLLMFLALIDRGMFVPDVFYEILSFRLIRNIKSNEKKKMTET